MSTKSQEVYEDDFEKDLDWLISEESRSEEQVSETQQLTHCTTVMTSFHCAAIFMTTRAQTLLHWTANYDRWNS